MNLDSFNRLNEELMYRQNELNNKIKYANVEDFKSLDKELTQVNTLLKGLSKAILFYKIQKESKKK